MLCNLADVIWLVVSKELHDNQSFGLDKDTKKIKIIHTEPIRHFALQRSLGLAPIKENNINNISTVHFVTTELTYQLLD